MPQIYHPDKPSGTSRFLLFCIAVWEYLFNGKFPFIDTDTVKVERGPNGYAFKASLPTAGGKAGSVKSDYAGIYVPGQSYDALQTVVVQGGNANGEYISTANGNTNAPITGINWVQLSALPQWF